MTYDQLVNHFGSQAETARVLKVSRQSVNLWKKHGIPAERELQAEGVTEGALQASEAARQYAAKFARYVAA